VNRRFKIPLFLILSAIAAILAYFRYTGSEGKEGTMKTTGLIEAREIDISPKIGEKIVWLCCREGDQIKKGELLMRLDDRELKAALDEGKATLKGAEASYQASEANLENARARVEYARAEIKAAESEIDRTRALFDEAREDFQRISNLFKEGYATRKDLDAARAAYDSKNAQLNAAIAKREGLDAELEIARASFKAAEAQLTTARANIGEARARLKLAETRLMETKIFAPRDGVIAYKYFEEGETVSPGKVVYTLYDLKEIWARVDVEETRIGGISLGKGATIKIDSLPVKSFEGEVIEIGREAEFATQRDVTRGRQDIKTFRVKVAVKDPDGSLKPGMTVIVEFKQ